MEMYSILLRIFISHIRLRRKIQVDKSESNYIQYFNLELMPNKINRERPFKTQLLIMKK
jgi:hypothetical protein